MAMKPGYHHGDLRAALIELGMAALEREPLDALSLRALARGAGVSATAVYRHFPDKEALVHALAMAALDRMADSQRRASDSARDRGATAAFCASGIAYVRFAIAHPALFRLIWRKPAPVDMLSVPRECMHPAMLGLRDGIAAVLPPGASERQQRAAAVRSWALVHGLAVLALDGHVAVDDAMIDAVIGGYADRLGEAV